MTRGYARFFVGYLALIGALSARPAHADTPTLPAPARDALLYRAPSACPDRAQFIAAVRERGGNFGRPGAAPALHFEVNIEQAMDGFHAALAVHNGTDTSNPREVSAPSCAEVVDALAVVTAIALNPPAAEPSAAPATPVPPPVVARAPAPHEPPRSTLRGASSFAWKKTVEVPAGKMRLDSDSQINARCGASLGFAPHRALPRLDLSFSRANFVSAPNGQSYLTGTIAHLRVSLLADTTWRFGDVRAQVGGQEIGVGLCFSPHYDSAGWVLLGCGELSVGLIGVKQQWVGPSQVHQYYPGAGSGPDSLTTTQGFGALGLSVEASYNLGAHFQIGALIGAQTFTRQINATNLADGSELFHSSPVIGTAALGVGTHF